MATFKTKILNFTWVIHKNWLAKIELSGPGCPGHQYVIIVVRVYCWYAKMLKETETEEARLSCHVFITSGISIRAATPMLR